jgi:hypothetical protein
MNDSITPGAMIAILALPNAEAEAALYERLRYLDRTVRLSYSEIGFISKTVQTYLLHEHRTDPQTNKPCSFTRWLRLAAPFGYSTAFAAMKDMEDLRDIPAEHLAEIPQSSFHVLKQLSTAVRAEPTVIEAAKNKSTDDFVEQIRKDHPDQHLESHKMLRVNMEESALVVVKEAIREAEKRGATNQSEALEAICAEALTQWKYEEEIRHALEVEELR